jgi:DNA-binding YbaB/EbfC family protein
MAKKTTPGRDMLDQIERLRRELQQAQEELKDEVVQASAGGGAVVITMSGTQECRSVEISQELIDEGDVGLLQDLCLLAINQAIQDSQVLAARRLGPLSGGLNLPGLGG